MFLKLTLIIIIAVATMTHAFPPTPPDFLDHFDETLESKTMWKSRSSKATTALKLTDRSAPWPLDEPPWDFVTRVVQQHCRNATACWFRDLHVPARMVLNDDSRPVRTNVSIMVEGVWHPYHYCCTREILTQQLAHVLRMQHDARNTEFMLYKTVDRQTNQTISEWRPLYHAPRGIIVSRGHRKKHQHFWLGIMINTPTTRYMPAGQCARAHSIVGPMFRWSLENDYKVHNGLGLIQCFWPNFEYDPVFVEPYVSVAEQLVKGSFVPTKSPYKLDDKDLGDDDD